MIWSLQSLRFIAALMIVYVHAAQIAAVTTGSPGFIPQSIAIAGRAGVDIFFVLSGIIITKTAQGLTAEQFAWRRFRRIIPFYFVCCIPAVLIAAKTGFGWREVLATFALWPATDQMVPPLMPVAWTLCFEILFYAAATLVLIDKRFLYAVLGGYAAALAFRSSGPVLQFLGNPIIAEFLLGVLLFYASRWRLAVLGIPLGAAVILLAGPLGFAPDQGTLEALIGEQGFRRLLVYGIPAALIVYGVMQIEARPSVFTYLGDASYSLYLSHVLILSPLWTLWAHFPMQADFTIAVGMIASVLFAWRVHELVEKPILRALGRRQVRAVAA